MTTSFYIGNKVDKGDEREVPERIGKNFADANGFDYFLVSRRGGEDSESRYPLVKLG